MHCKAGRRGIWYRMIDDDNAIEIVAGREGDDASVVIRGPEANLLKQCLAYGAWMQEDEGPDDMKTRVQQDPRAPLGRCTGCSPSERGNDGATHQEGTVEHPLSEPLL
ncbi:MAG: hypothetical protein KIPDCIKN_04370 [Haliscomenobacter sp.]|nr:hypothetical protein [Haliscomenobacter sp.]